MKKRKGKVTIKCGEGKRDTRNQVASLCLVRKLIFWMILLYLNLFLLGAEGGIVINHESVSEVDKIPDYWISEVKKMLLNVPGESHSAAYRDGLLLLKEIPGYEKFDVAVSTVPEAPTDAHLRITRYFRNENNTLWKDSAGEEDFWTSTRAVNMMNQHLTYMKNDANPVHAFGFAWCWDMVIGNPGGTEDFVYKVKWAGASYDLDGVNHGIWGLDDEDNALTGNEINMQDYLDAVDNYNANVPETVTFFTTGTVDGYKGENGYQGYLKNEFIRSYVRSSVDKVLFDYADILCYDDDGLLTTRTWTDRWGDTHKYPFITSTNSGDGSIGHIGEVGAVRLAKALWVLMARIAGWNGCPAVKGDFNGDCQVDLTDLAVFTDCWILHAGENYCQELCDFFPEIGDGIIGFDDFTVFSRQWRVQSCPVIYMDFDGSCTFDWGDIKLFAQYWLSEQGSANWNEKCDLLPAGGDGRIDFWDFAVIAKEWSEQSGL